MEIVDNGQWKGKCIENNWLIWINRTDSKTVEKVPGILNSHENISKLFNNLWEIYQEKQNPLKSNLKGKFLQWNEILQIIGQLFEI